MAAASDFKGLIEPVITHFRGEPNKRLSTKTERRWGNNGSLWADLAHDGWTDHQAGEGGGILDFVARETGCQANGEAAEWLRAHGFLPEREKENGDAGEEIRREIEATYDYVDETGEPVFQVVRYRLLNPDGSLVTGADGKPKKDIRQRRRARPDDSPDKVRDGWCWSMKGVKLMPYRLPEVVEAIALERPVYIVEGEKCADRLASLGLAATTNSGGAGKWPEHFAGHFAGAHVVILADNDDPGAEHADVVAKALAPVAASLCRPSLPGLAAKGDVADWLDAGGTIEGLLSIVEETPAIDPNAPLPYRSRFRAVWFRDIDQKPPEREWIVKGVLPSRGFSLVYGEPGCGKSFLMLDMGLMTALAAREAAEHYWFGHRIKPAGVIYIAGEGQDDFKLRMQAWRQRREILPGEDLPFVLLPTRIDLRTRDGEVKPLIDEIKAHAASMRAGQLLVVVDTVSRALAAGDENSPVDMGGFVENCGVIERETLAQVAGVHHVPKGGTTPRGHGSLLGAVDIAIDVVKPEEGNNSWSVRKSKVGPEGGSHAFSLDSVELGIDRDGDAITTCVVREIEGEARRGAKGSRRSDQQEIFLQALRTALADHAEQAPGVLHLPHGMRVVHYDYFKREFIARAFSEEPSDEAVRQAIKRHGDALVARAVIGRARPYLWIARRDAE